MKIQKESNNLFPVFLKLEQMRLLIVGGGKVGLEKLKAVIQNSPATNITLVGSEISDEIKIVCGSFPLITLYERPYQTSDLHQTDIVIIATDDKDLSRVIHWEAKKHNRLVNVADTPDLCDFYLGAIVQKGNLKLAISTNGKSPTIAKRLKEVLSEVLPAQLDEVLDNMQVIRNRLKGNFEARVQQLNELTRVLIEKRED